MKDPDDPPIAMELYMLLKVVAGLAGGLFGVLLPDGSLHFHNLLALDVAMWATIGLFVGVLYEAAWVRTDTATKPLLILYGLGVPYGAVCGSVYHLAGYGWTRSSDTILATIAHVMMFMTLSGLWVIFCRIRFAMDDWVYRQRE